MWMLDTNICIYAIKRRPPTVIERLLSCPAAKIHLSTVTLSELEYGVYRSQHQDVARRALQQFAAPFTVLPFDEEAAARAGQLRADLRRRGTPIGPLDVLIAGHALSRGLTLVTHNAREFDRVTGLHVEDWA